jgi:hypothetical protein
MFIDSSGSMISTRPGAFIDLIGANMSALQRGVLMGKEDWYFVVGTLLGIAGLLGVPWREVFGKAKAAMHSPKREIFMVLALLGSLVMSSIGWYRASHLQPDLTKFPEKKLERISGRTFVGGVVELDGKLFENCTFNGVTLMYHGAATYSLVQPKWAGSIFIKTDNKAIHDFEFLRVYMRNMGKFIKVGSEQESVNTCAFAGFL